MSELDRILRKIDASSVFSSLSSSQQERILYVVKRICRWYPIAVDTESCFDKTALRKKRYYVRRIARSRMAKTERLIDWMEKWATRHPDIVGAGRYPVHTRLVGSPSGADLIIMLIYAGQWYSGNRVWVFRTDLEEGRRWASYMTCVYGGKNYAVHLDYALDLAMSSARHGYGYGGSQLIKRWMETICDYLDGGRVYRDLEQAAGRVSSRTEQQTRVNASTTRYADIPF